MTNIGAGQSFTIFPLAAKWNESIDRHCYIYCVPQENGAHFANRVAHMFDFILRSFTDLYVVFFPVCRSTSIHKIRYESQSHE